MKRIRNRNREKEIKPRITPARARVESWKSLIVDLYLQGNTMQRVGELAKEQTGHSFGSKTVSKWVNEAILQWQEHKSQFIENHRAIELAKINKLEITYWDAWVRSCEIAKSKSTTKKKSEEGERLAVAQVKEDEKPTNGDPQFLRGIQWCVDTRCKILGIDTPQVAVQVNNNNTNSTTIVRRVVFKTRETTAAPQVITQLNAE